MKRRISGEDSDTPAQGDSERFSILRARQVTCLAEHVKSTRNGRAVCADIVLVPSRLPEDIGTRIREFLQNCEGYKLEKHPGSDVEWGFQLVGESETRGEIKGTTEVFQPKNRTDYIAVTQIRARGCHG